MEYISIRVLKISPPPRKILTAYVREVHRATLYRGYCNNDLRINNELERNVPVTLYSLKK